MEFFSYVADFFLIGMLTIKLALLEKFTRLEYFSSLTLIMSIFPKGGEGET